MKSVMFALAVVACACVGVAHATEWPAGIADEAAVDAIIQTGGQGQRRKVEAHSLPFTFDVPLDGEMFKDLDTMFLQVMDEPEAGSESAGSEGAKADPSTDTVPGTPAHAIGEAFKNEPPIVCETVCRPMDEEEAKTATKQAETIENDANEKAKETDAELDLPMGKAVGTEDNNADAGSFLQLSAKICEAKGGAFKNGECDEFMRSSEGKTKYAPKKIFGVCNTEFGNGYVPCSPYQALALAHLYKVADHSYYWLWPGGRHDQNTGAVMKQQIGNNPVAGLDQCPDKQHVGFFHNWDEAHVDSWGCLHDEQELPVLCCRQK